MGDGSGSTPGARYYKSDRRPLPIIFVQKRGLWRSYAPGGVLLISQPGRIPPETLEQLEEIDEAQAQGWLSADVREVTRASGAVAVEKTKTAPPVLFEPRRWREFVFGPAILFVLAFIAFAITRIVKAVKYPDLVWRGELLFGLALLLFVLLVVALSLSRRRTSSHTLGLSATEVTGRSGVWGGGRSNIPVDDLDRVRSAKRSLAGRLLGWQCLYSRRGRRIVFVRRYFDGETIRGLLDRLGIQR